MSCSVFVHIKYTKELENIIKNLHGAMPKEKFKSTDIDRYLIPAELFPQHKKEDDAHRWVNKGDRRLHYPTNEGKWEYLSHGFEVWFNFEGDIVFIVPCHWNGEHGDQTLLDMKKWIEDNLGIVEIKEGRVSD